MQKESILMAEFTELLRYVSPTVLDVREEDAYLKGHIKGAQHFPMSELAQRMSALEEEEIYYVVCQKGFRSEQVARQLRQNGFQAIDVQGGMDAWQATTVRKKRA